MAFLRLIKVTGYLKTFIKIMVSLNFHDVSDDTTIEVIANQNTNYLYVGVERDDQLLNLELDKSTAIKFSKELRKQIALLD